MSDIRYIVKTNDSLRKISKHFLGDSEHWKNIFQYNNRPEIVSKTKYKLTNPNLIFVGQPIYIPEKHNALTDDNFKYNIDFFDNSSGNAKAKKIHGIGMKFDFTQNSIARTVTPNYIATIKFTGSIHIKKKGTYDFMTISKNGFEIQETQKMKNTFENLIGYKIGFNKNSKTIFFECNINLFSYCKNPNIPELKATVVYKPLPTYKVSLTRRSFKGEINGYLFSVQDFGVEIEITTTLQKPNLPEVEWNPSFEKYFWGGLCFVAAGSIVVLAVLDDCTIVGIGNDAIAFTAAYVLFKTGSSLINKPVMMNVRPAKI